MPRPIVALLTDFGTRDHYAGAMKGAVLSVCPDATLVDITHHVPPQDVLAGALELSASYRFFPPGTIFLVVVDPGVGSNRRAIAAESGEFRFVAPDNGVLTGVFHDTPPASLVELTELKYARPSLSRTFEGRDRFAPAAGWLARGLALDALGPRIADYHRIEVPEAALTETSAAGMVLRVDHFGNLITNLQKRTLERLMAASPVVVRVAGCTVPFVVSTYAEAPDDELCALFGSSDHLEIAVRGGSAAARLGVGRGAPVVVAQA